MPFLQNPVFTRYAETQHAIHKIGWEDAVGHVWLFREVGGLGKYNVLWIYLNR